MLTMSIGYKTVLTNPTIAELAEKYKVTPAQIVLGWHVARGVSVVPKSSNEQRQKDNINVCAMSDMGGRRPSDHVRSSPNWTQKT